MVAVLVLAGLTLADVLGLTVVDLAGLLIPVDSSGVVLGVGVSADIVPLNLSDSIHQITGGLRLGGSLRCLWLWGLWDIFAVIEAGKHLLLGGFWGCRSGGALSLRLILRGFGRVQY